MKVAKWGNSLAVRIPRDVAEALDLKEGDDIALSPGTSGAFVVDKALTREQAIRSLRQFRGRLPADFKFDRDEANAR